MANSRNNVFKIIVIGDSGVGKSCLAYRYCTGTFPKLNPRNTTSVDFCKKSVNMDGEEFPLIIWDTAGFEKNHNSMLNHYYRNLDAVVFVYDVTRLASFTNLPHWISEVDLHQETHDIPKILVGNKCDCEDSQKAVVTSTASTFASRHGMMFFETSALDDSMADEVDAIFMTIARKIKDRIPENSSQGFDEEPMIILRDDYSERKRGLFDRCSTTFAWFVLNLREKLR